MEWVNKSLWWCNNMNEKDIRDWSSASFKASRGSLHLYENLPTLYTTYVVTWLNRKRFKKEVRDQVSHVRISLFFQGHALTDYTENQYKMQCGQDEMNCSPGSFGPCQGLGGQPCYQYSQEDNCAHGLKDCMRSKSEQRLLLANHAKETNIVGKFVGVMLVAFLLSFLCMVARRSILQNVGNNVEYQRLA